MTITIEGNDGSKSVIDVDSYGPVGTCLFSLKTVLEVVTSALFTVHSSEKKAEAREAALREEAMSGVEVLA